jgi:peptidoglycan LD-endopeptidase LytH
MIPWLAACFAAGTITGWLTHTRIIAPKPVASTGVRPEAATAIAAPPPPEKPSIAPPPDRAALDASRRGLRLPIEGATLDAMKGQFAEPREGNARSHEAVDLLAPRGTPIHAVDDGIIAKLFQSKAGGTTIYQFDSTERFCYYYAHLQRYADGLREGQSVEAGKVIGYVGTSGNAPPNTPHLHFAVFELTPERAWWRGRPLDPYVVFGGNHLPGD